MNRLVLHPNPADAGLSEIAEICACSRPDLQHNAREIGEKLLFVFGCELLVFLVETGQGPREDSLAYHLSSRKRNVIASGAYFERIRF
jgi:hypothetical protein